MSLPDDLDCLSPAELKDLVVQPWKQIAELQRMAAALRDKIAQSQGGLGRNIKPSGMERGTEVKSPEGSGGKKRGRGSTRLKLTIDEARIVKVAAPPRGSRFKGYTSFIEQAHQRPAQDELGARAVIPGAIAETPSLASPNLRQAPNCILGLSRQQVGRPTRQPVPPLPEFILAAAKVT